jgi:hypothetical protein
LRHSSLQGIAQASKRSKQEDEHAFNEGIKYLEFATVSVVLQVIVRRPVSVLQKNVVKIIHKPSVNKEGTHRTFVLIQILAPLMINNSATAIRPKVHV